MIELYARPGQRLKDHLKEVESEITKKNPEYKYLGILHDIAKVSQRFQDKLDRKNNNKSEKINRFRHPIAALPIADYVLNFNDEEQNDSRLLKLMVIYYHHSPISFDMIQNDILKTEHKIKNDFILNREEIGSAFKILNEMVGEKYDVNNFIDKLTDNNSTSSSLEELYIKKINEILREFYSRLEFVDPKFKKEFALMYSSLINADWKSSGERALKIDWSDLIQKFDNQFNKRFESENSVQKVVWSQENLQKNKLFLVAPTGSGKSEASLRWALEKAKEKGMKRIIYVLPLRGLIEDLYGRFKNYLGEENIDVWDSDYLFTGQGLNIDKLENFDEFNFNITMRKYFYKTPLIITTADQILMSFLNVGRYPIRLGLFNESVFVFDEIQSYGHLIRLLLYKFIDNICQDIPVFIMTATPPKEVVDNKGFLNQFDIIKNEGWFEEYHSNTPVTINLRKSNHKLERSESDKVTKELAKEVIGLVEKYKKIAVVVNTVNLAKKTYQQIYDKLGYNTGKKKKQKLGEKLPLVLLHSQLTREHRKNRLDKILNKDRYILVSTQVIEAGVDANFDACIRMVAPIESLVQTLGRVNRPYHKKYNQSEFIIMTYKTKDASFLPYNNDEIIQVSNLLDKMFEGEKTYSKSEFENNIIKLSKEKSTYKFDESKEYIDYICTKASEVIWTTDDVRDLLGSSFRENLGKRPVFVRPKQGDSKVDLYNKLKETREQLKLEYDKENMERYIKILRVLSGNYINCYGNREEINWKEYIKNYALSEEDR